jgi:short-subunit dehydrogenase
MVDINLHGVIWGAKLALARMIPRNAGAIVNIASQAGLYGAPGGATYSATKHGVVGLSEAIRGELRLAGHDGIQISYVCPVVVNTELGQGTANTNGVKMVQPQDVADAIVDALQHGVVDVHVPKSVKRIGWTTRMLPRRASEGIARALKADRVLFEADPNARAAYELRAAQSEPGLEPAEEAKQLTA